MSTLKVLCGGMSRTVSCEPDETVLSALRREGFSVPAPCGGKGLCGKCRLNINGVRRLACRTKVAEGATVEVPEFMPKDIMVCRESIDSSCCGKETLAAAVDLGTTTVVIGVYDLNTGDMLCSVKALNILSLYGSDVISRIRYTIENPDGLAEMSECLRNQVSDLIDALLDEIHREAESLSHIAVAGNTVMQHLFAGIQVKSMAAAPYKPECLFFETTGDSLLGVKVMYAPCIAGYVGGDITAGLLASGLYKKDEHFLFIDIGTNGEMVLGGKDGLICCAVASGPAFEGSGINCGMPGLTGAVSHVAFDGQIRYDVIGDVQPEGICGSGLIDLTAVLLEQGCIDRGGRLLPQERISPRLKDRVKTDSEGNGVFYLNDKIFLTAGDVRKIQLAKAAFAAGISVLLKERGIKISDLDGIYIAGAFGESMSSNNATAIGMIPPLPPEKIHCLGNTALAGAAEMAVDSERTASLFDAAAKCDYIELSGRDDFARLFAENMSF